jgi:hypothetical protein
VEKERGLTFLHPVTVKFLEPAAFEKWGRTDAGDLDAHDREQIKQVTAVLRALGLLDGDVDLFKAFNDATGSGTLAYYSFDDQTITVKGKKLVLAARATLVHELTHALQDQRFGIGDREERLQKEAEDGAPTTASDAFDALVEGDAQRVADLYRHSLSDQDQTALAKAEDADQSDDLDQLKDVPKFVLTLIGAPYTLGQAMTEAVVADDAGAIDDLFRHPPTNDSVLLDPLRAIDPTDARDVSVPATAAGEKKVDSGQVGALTTYLMLAQRLPLRDALAAADGWDGDAYLAFTRGGNTCVRVSYAGDTSAGTQRLRDALQRWIGAEAGTPATVADDGDHVRFESCDPGTGVKQRRDVSEDALQLIATRAYLGSGLLEAGAPADVSRCFAREMIREYSVADLTDPTYGKNDPKVRAHVQQIVRDCR